MSARIILEDSGEYSDDGSVELAPQTKTRRKGLWQIDTVAMAIERLEAGGRIDARYALRNEKQRMVRRLLSAAMKKYRKNVFEVAFFLGVSVQTVRNWLREVSYAE